MLDAAEPGAAFGAPVFFILGHHGHQVSAEVAARRFADLRTPLRRLVWLERSARNIRSEEPHVRPAGGQEPLNRLEHAPAGEPGRYHRIGHDAAAIEALFVDLFLDAHRSPPRQIVLDLDATDVPLQGHQEGRFFHGYYDAYCYLPLYVFCGPRVQRLLPCPAERTWPAAPVAPYPRRRRRATASLR